MGLNPVLLAWIAAVLLAIAALFQVGLAAGAPWGAMAYGGRVVPDHGPLPGRYRAISVVGAIVLLGAIWVVLAAVAVLDRGPVPPFVLNAALWFLAAYFALNTLGNALGRHPVERWVAGPAAAALSVLCALIAMR